jgi:hypothetical protein
MENQKKIITILYDSSYFERNHHHYVSNNGLQLCKHDFKANDKAKENYSTSNTCQFKFTSKASDHSLHVLGKEKSTHTTESLHFH